MNTVIKIILLVILVSLPMSAQQTTFQDSLLDHMKGKWVLRGQIAGKRQCTTSKRIGYVSYIIDECDWWSMVPNYLYAWFYTNYKQRDDSILVNGWNTTGFIAQCWHDRNTSQHRSIAWDGNAHHRYQPLAI